MVTFSLSSKIIRSAVFLPADLPSPFTVKDFSQKTGLRGRDAYSAVHVLEKLNLIVATEPIGRAMAFTIYT